MATISGGSKPTFTVDQVLHAAEMNQLNQEWIVDSVPAGSAGKNGDVVFVTSKGGVWAKVSGSWVQASLTSADTQALQDQIDSIQSSGYDDTQLRSDFAAADAATLSSANAYTDQEVAAITVPDVSDLATKTEVSDGDTATLTAANAYTDGKVYDATSLEADVAQNTSDISSLQTEQSTQDSAIQANSDAIAAITTYDDTALAARVFTNENEIDVLQGNEADQNVSIQANTDALAGKSDTDHIHNAVPAHSHPHDHNGEYAEPNHTHTSVPSHNHSDYATKTELTNGLADKADDDHVHIQTGSGLTFDPAREGQVVQSTNGTDWTAGMSLRVVTSVPDDTEGEIGDVVFVVGS